MTDQQVPAWFHSNPGVTIIDHTEIIPAHLLPTFSSVCIETFLNNIPGLSEHFIYSNDDCFINRPLCPQDFFDQDGRPIVWLDAEKADSITFSEAQKFIQDPNTKGWFKTLEKAWVLFSQKTQISTPFYIPSHSIDAFTKTLFTETLQAFPEVLEANISPIRTDEEISRVIFPYYMAFRRGCSLKIAPKNNFWHRLKAKLYPQTTETYMVMRNEFNKLLRDLRVLNPKTFCINSIPNQRATEILAFLESRFPEKAPWEK